MLKTMPRNLKASRYRSFKLKKINRFSKNMMMLNTSLLAIKTS